MAMNLDQLFLWLQQTDIATTIREGDAWFPWIECVHVLALTLVIGSIAIVDLRLLGWASRQLSIGKLSAEVLPCTWLAFAVAVISGLLLFSSNAVKYSHNFPFQLKMLLLVLAGLNMSIFHLFVNRRMKHWETAAGTPWPAKLAGAASLVLWIGIAAFGRWIGFTMAALV
jgi:hypothetical protein